MATISDDIIRWNCDACTFSNPKSVDKCLICQAPQSMEALQFIKDLEQQRRQAQIKIQHQKQLENMAPQKVTVDKIPALKNIMNNIDDNMSIENGDDNAGFVDDDDDVEFNDDDDGWDDDGDGDDDWDDIDDNKDGNNNDWNDITYNNSDLKTEPIKDKLFEVLTVHSLKEYQLTIIKEIQDTLNFNDINDVLICCWYYKWNKSQLMDEYLTNPNKVLLKCGVKSSKSNKNIQKNGTFYCYLCLYEYNITNTIHIGCGHQFCVNCFSKYLETKLLELGPQCILTRCIEPKCKKTIISKYWIKYLTNKFKNKYNEYLLHSFVSNQSKLRWCPGNDCNYAVKCDIGSMEQVNIKCLCGHEWCFSCRKANHLPCSCELANKWLVLHKTDSENVTWARAHGKECKKCGNYIEKNQGCNHMTCRCGYEFCWLCKKEWKGVGGYGHKCNKPQEVIDEENEQERMKNYLQRFMHYFTRYDSHDKSAQFAQNKSYNNAIACRNYFVGMKGKNYKMKDLEYVLESIQEIIVSRKVLQWSYAYGYYLKDKTQIKNLFETQQGMLESFADRLHGETEDIIDNKNKQKWNTILNIKYRQNLITLTSTVMKYRTNLCNYLKDVKFQYQPGLGKLM